MSHSHSADLDRAVLLARRAATAGRLDRPEPLTRLLYQRWFLGRPQPATPAVPAQRTATPTPSATPSAAPSAGPSAGPWRTWGGGWERRECRGAELVRVYFACAPRTSLHVVGAVTTHAQGWDVPWLLSSRAMSQPLPAVDATVLYVPADALPALHGPLTRLLEDVQPFLGTSVPAMTLKIAPGVALAQNPADGRPYGEHRCSVIAGTVLAHAHRGHRDVVERTTAAFRRVGVDPRRPYRAVGATWRWAPQGTPALSPA